MEESSFDQRVGGVSFSRLERELELDQQRFRRLLNQYEDLRAILEELNEAIQQRKRLLESLRENAPDPSSPELESDESQSMTKPQIAERVLQESFDPLYPRQVRDVAVARGWLAEDAASRNQLGVAMSKMARKGRLVKDEDGRYRLADTD
jgi:chromosome segregation ATPase